jgi:hypothetical protein
VVTAEEVAAREPDLIIGWWCGKKFLPEQVVARPGFGPIPAVRNQDLYEIKSLLILQPGPAALTDGLREHQGAGRQVGRWRLVPAPTIRVGLRRIDQHAGSSAAASRRGVNCFGGIVARVPLEAISFAIRTPGLSARS